MVGDGQPRPLKMLRPGTESMTTKMFPQGSHQFDLRDPDGNLWTVGTFQPRIPASDE
jgi:hypothetical protein